MINKKNLEIFQKKINYKFKDPSILKQSLTHPSYLIDRKNIKNHSNQFERFEFLGDRVLGLIVSFLLFDKFQDSDEGDLSKKYSYLVQKNFLYKISLDLSIDQILLYNYKYNNKKMIKSILSDSVESLIGGIYIDGGYKSSFNFIKKFWMPHLNIKISKAQDPKTTLQEISQQKLKKLPEYKLIKRKGPAHSPLFTVQLSVLNLNKIFAEGSSIREAERIAANLALNKINEKKDT